MCADLLLLARHWISDFLLPHSKKIVKYSVSEIKHAIEYTQQPIDTNASFFRSSQLPVLLICEPRSVRPGGNVERQKFYVTSSSKAAQLFGGCEQRTGELVGYLNRYVWVDNCRTSVLTSRKETTQVAEITSIHDSEVIYNILWAR